MATAAPNPIAVRTAKIVAHATDVLDGKENSLAWLEQPNYAMGGRTPYEVLDDGNPVEIEQLDQQLYALEHGIYP